MEINRQLFEDVLSGKLKGTFVLRDGRTFNSKYLKRTENTFFNHNNYSPNYPYALVTPFTTASYTEKGIWNRRLDVSSIDIIDFIPDTDMKENELTIEIPDGKIVDWDESKKQNKIVLKDKPLTYEDVCKELFEDDHYTIAWEGYPIEYCSGIYNASNATTKHQLECILAKNQLANVAKYLNGEWKPDKGDHVFAITYKGNFENEPFIGEFYFGIGEYLVLFKTQKAAQQAIEILGEETIKLALEPLGV